MQSLRSHCESAKVSPVDHYDPASQPNTGGQSETEIAICDDFDGPRTIHHIYPPVQTIRCSAEHPWPLFIETACNGRWTEIVVSTTHSGGDIASSAEYRYSDGRYSGGVWYNGGTVIYLYSPRIGQHTCDRISVENRDVWRWLPDDSVLNNYYFNFAFIFVQAVI